MIKKSLCVYNQLCQVLDQLNEHVGPDPVDEWSGHWAIMPTLAGSTPVWSIAVFAIGQRM